MHGDDHSCDLGADVRTGDSRRVVLADLADLAGPSGVVASGVRR